MFEVSLSEIQYLKAHSIITQNNPEDWEEACEALNNSLSYDKNNCNALRLLGYLYAEFLLDIPKAFACFERVIEIEPLDKDVYILYAEYLIWTGDFVKAQKMIDYAVTLKGLDNSKLFWCKALMSEKNHRFDSALECLQQAKLEVTEDDYWYFLEGEIKRVESKQELSNVDKDKPKHSGKEKKNTNEPEWVTQLQHGILR